MTAELAAALSIGLVAVLTRQLAAARRWRERPATAPVRPRNPRA